MENVILLSYKIVTLYPLLLNSNAFVSPNLVCKIIQIHFVQIHWFSGPLILGGNPGNSGPFIDLSYCAHLLLP